MTSSPGYPGITRKIPTLNPGDLPDLPSTSTLFLPLLPQLPASPSSSLVFPGSPGPHATGENCFVGQKLRRPMVNSQLITPPDGCCEGEATFRLEAPVGSRASLVPSHVPTQHKASSAKISRRAEAGCPHSS